MSAREKTTGFIAEFRKFIARGNVLDLAVGVIIGGAFSKITTSLVEDIINPVLGIFTGGGEALSALALSLPGGAAGYGPLAALAAAVLALLALSYLAALKLYAPRAGGRAAQARGAGRTRIQ